MTIPKSAQRKTGGRALLILLIGMFVVLQAMAPLFRHVQAIGRKISIDSSDEIAAITLPVPREQQDVRQTALLERLRCKPSTEDSQGYNLPMYQFFGNSPETLPRINYGLEAKPEYSHSRFARYYPLRSTTNDNKVGAIHFIMLCDRINSSLLAPLKAFVNSVLTHASVPVAMHVVLSRNKIDWLDRLDSPFFQVNFYNYEKLGYLGNALRLLKKTKFRSSHTGMPYPLTKPFMSNLPLPGRAEGLVTRVIAVDDDILFWEDPVKLLELMPADKLALSCPTDLKRVYRYYHKTNTTNNGHDSRFCNSGLVHMPITPLTRPHELYYQTNDWLDWYVQAMEDMTTEYPGVKHRMSDQAVYNRVFRDHADEMGNIPCEWHCDYNSQRFTKGDWEFSNCPEIGKPGPDGNIVECKMFHFLHGAYKMENFRVDKEEHSYQHFLQQNSMELLYETFLPRILGEGAPLCRSQDALVVTSK